MPRWRKSTPASGGRKARRRWGCSQSLSRRFPESRRRRGCSPRAASRAFRPARKDSSCESSSRCSCRHSRQNCGPQSSAAPRPCPERLPDLHKKKAFSDSRSAAPHRLTSRRFSHCRKYSGSSRGRRRCIAASHRSNRSRRQSPRPAFPAFRPAQAPVHFPPLRFLHSPAFPAALRRNPRFDRRPAGCRGNRRV